MNLPRLQSITETVAKTWETVDISIESSVSRSLRREVAEGMVCSKFEFEVVEKIGRAING